MITYVGKICGKHPEMGGLRMGKNRQCRVCYLESKKRWGKNRTRDKVGSMVYSRLRRSNILKATPPWADQSKIKEIYDSRKPDQEVDHIVPLKGLDPITKLHVVCGLHVHHNLEVIDKMLNSTKWAWWEASK